MGRWERRGISYQRLALTFAMLGPQMHLDALAFADPNAVGGLDATINLQSVTLPLTEGLTLALSVTSASPGGRASPVGGPRVGLDVGEDERSEDHHGDGAVEGRWLVHAGYLKERT